MSEIKIFDNVSSIKVEIGDSVKLISKHTIRAIEIINDRICIDTGQGMLNYLFIDFADVTIPALPDITALQNQLQTMMQSIEVGLFDMLNQMSDTINEIKLTLDGTHDYFKEPLRVDEPSMGIVYKGYSSTLGANPSEPLWAISETKVSGTQTVTRWANATKEFTSVWNDRLSLTYL